MSILSIFQSKQPKSAKPTLTYAQKITGAKEPSSLLGQAKTVKAPPLSDVSKLESDYDKDTITKYIQ